MHDIGRPGPGRHEQHVRKTRGAGAKVLRTRRRAILQNIPLLPCAWPGLLQAGVHRSVSIGAPHRQGHRWRAGVILGGLSSGKCSGERANCCLLGNTQSSLQSSPVTIFLLPCTYHANTVRAWAGGIMAGGGPSQKELHMRTHPVKTKAKYGYNPFSSPSLVFRSIIPAFLCAYEILCFLLCNKRGRELVPCFGTSVKILEFRP